MKTLKWKHEDVVAICELYKKFLLLRKKYPIDVELVPSQEMDEIWHNHILDTKKYIEDCNSIFGFYLNHNPYDSDNKESLSITLNGFEHTQELFFKEYGYYIPEVRMNFLKYLKNILINLLHKKIINF